MAGMEFAAAKPRAMIIGTLLLIPLAACLVSARTLSFLIVLPLLAFVYLWAASPVRERPRVSLADPGAPALLLAGWAIVSALWAANPLLPLDKAPLALVYVVASIFMVHQAARADQLTLRHLGEGVCMGLSIGLTYCALEMLTDQSIKIFVYNLLELGENELTPPSWYTWDDSGRLLTVSWLDFTRNAAPISLFVWSAALACLGTLDRTFARVLAPCLVAVAVVVIMASPHETSQLAIVAGLISFALGRFAAALAPKLLMAGWLVATFLVVPVALGLHAAGLHTADWVQQSAQGRVIIWNITAEKTFDSPLVGVGANMAREIGLAHDTAAGGVPSADGTVPMMSIHSHNVFLQTWFELGFVGASLLAWLGIALIIAMTKLKSESRPYAYATFASAATMASASYGMWQFWFIAMFALTPVLVVIANLTVGVRSDAAAVED